MPLTDANDSHYTERMSRSSSIDPPSVPASPPDAARLRPATAAAAQAAAPRRFSTVELFDGDREIEIVHGEARYRLRHTASGKLILTK